MRSFLCVGAGYPARASGFAARTGSPTTTAGDILDHHVEPGRATEVPRTPGTWFFVHVMKTGGTSFFQHVRANLAPEQIWPSPTDRPAPGSGKYAVAEQIRHLNRRRSTWDPLLVRPLPARGEPLPRRRAHHDGPARSGARIAADNAYDVDFYRYAVELYERRGPLAEAAGSDRRADD